LLHDITPRITSELKVFPGDTPPSREVLLDIDRGDHITLSTLRGTVHLGAHVDAPSHYTPGGDSIEAFPLDRVLGPCRVVDVSGAIIQTEEGRLVVSGPWIEGLETPRVLLRTGTHPDPDRWSDDFAGLSAPLVEELAERGVLLVGIDTPSVDPPSSKALPAHQAFARTGVSILEGITLAAVPEGRYELIALPLPLEGFDASPVRAVLREVSS
jgi:arylformamidase